LDKFSVYDDYAQRKVVAECITELEDQNQKLELKEEESASMLIDDDDEEEG
jgi:hypothetical protein